MMTRREFITLRGGVAAGGGRSSRRCRWSDSSLRLRRTAAPASRRVPRGLEGIGLCRSPECDRKSPLCGGSTPPILGFGRVLICSITGFHKACSVSVRGRDGRGCCPGRAPADIGTPSELPTGGAPGICPAVSERPVLTRPGGLRRVGRPGLGRERPTGKIRTGRTGLSRRAARWASTSVIGDAAWRRVTACGGVHG